MIDKTSIVFNSCRQKNSVLYKWKSGETLRDSVLSSPTSAPTLPEWPCQEQRGYSLNLSTPTYTNGYDQAHNQLGTPERRRVFWKGDNTFKLCPTHISKKGAIIFLRGASRHCASPRYGPGYDRICSMLVWRRGTDHWPCCPSVSNPSTSMWSAP